jgi:hypothetical protein
MNSRVPNISIPPSSRSWTRVLLGLGVGVPVALAPLLGKLQVPLFPALLNLIPDSIQNVAIPTSAAAMALVAASVEFRVYEQLDRKVILANAKKAMILCGVSLGFLVIAYTLLVTRVDILGGDQYVAVITGWRGTSAYPCNGVGLEECVKIVTLKKSAISSYFGDVPIKIASLLLEGLYVSFFACFGNLAGILVAIQGHRGPVGCDSNPGASGRV